MLTVKKSVLLNHGSDFILPQLRVLLRLGLMQYQVLEKHVPGAEAPGFSGLHARPLWDAMTQRSLPESPLRNPYYGKHLKRHKSLPKHSRPGVKLQIKFSAYINPELPPIVLALLRA